MAVSKLASVNAAELVPIAEVDLPGPVQAFREAEPPAPTRLHCWPIR